MVLLNDSPGAPVSDGFVGPLDLRIPLVFWQACKPKICVEFDQWLDGFRWCSFNDVLLLFFSVFIVVQIVHVSCLFTCVMTDICVPPFH